MVWVQHSSWIRINTFSFTICWFDNCIQYDQCIGRKQIHLGLSTGVLCFLWSILFNTFHPQSIMTKKFCIVNASNRHDVTDWCVIQLVNNYVVLRSLLPTAVIISLYYCSDDFFLLWINGICHVCLNSVAYCPKLPPTYLK